MKKRMYHVHEFIEFHAKSYVCVQDDKTTIKSKGIRPHIIRYHLSFKDPMWCLMGSDSQVDEDDKLDDEKISKRYLCS